MERAAAFETGRGAGGNVLSRAALFSLSFQLYATDSSFTTTLSETKGLAIGIGLDLRLLVTRGATWRGGAPVARAPPPK